MIELESESEVGERGRKKAYRVVKGIAKRKRKQGRREEEVHRVVESGAKREVKERSREVGHRRIEIIGKGDGESVRRDGGR